MKIGLALHELHRSEDELAEKLLHASDRHKVDHEVFHVGRDLARWSQEHVRALAEAGQRHDLDLELVGREPQASLLLLLDLREIYMRGCGVSVDWELLAQAAQGAKDAKLLGVVERCHPESRRQVRWANGKLGESATQILLS